MKMRSLSLPALALCATIWAAPVPAGAQPLPAFPVATPDGATVSGTTIAPAGEWLLVYLTPGSEPSEKLVRSLAEWWTAEASAPVVLILSGSAADARAFLAFTGGEHFAASVAWYLDPQRAAWKALGFQGNLAVARIEGQTLDWKIDGVIGDPAVVEVAIKRVLKGAAGC